MQIWLYTPKDHIPCGVIDYCESPEIVHRSIKPGEISFECPLDDIASQIQEKALVWPEGDETAFIVTTCKKYTNENGEEVISVKGKCLKWILNQRALTLSKIYKGKSGAVLNQMLAELQGNRAFPRFSWQIDSDLGDDITMEASPGPYLTNIEAICDASSLTMKVLWDSTERTMVLMVTAGADRTVDNEDGNTPILFDETLETMRNIEYTESIADSKNVMYITDADDVVLEVGETDAAGFERFEDCTSDSGGKTVTNADGSTTTLTSAQYYQKKVEAAQKELDKERPVKSATGTLPADEQMVAYSVDYALGDIVTVRKAGWNVNVDVRITEESLRERNHTLTRTLTIGDPLPTIAERIKMR
ncbi:MAG: hypothetical protein PHY64_00240 [Eubacteriales bacterium]|nr:hypothetical protein [Eubacteriales bacterium]